MRGTVSLVLTFLIAIQPVLGAAQTTTTDPQEIRWRLLGQKQGTTVTVTLRDGTRVEGRLGKVTESHFELQVEDQDSAGSDEQFTEFRFEEVTDVSIHPEFHYPDRSSKWSTKKTLVLTGALATAVVIITLVGLSKGGS